MSSDDSPSPTGAVASPPDSPAIEWFFEQDMEEGLLRNCAGGDAAIFSARCPGMDGANEDAAALMTLSGNRAVLAVADGSGGHPGAAQASRVALETLMMSIRTANPVNGQLREAIMDGFDKANRAVRELGAGSATTLVVAELQGDLMRPYHAGDSTILLLGQRGKIKFKTVSHSPVGYAVEAGVMDERKAMDHEERHLVSNLVGCADMRIEVGPSMKLARRDTLVLASDCLFDNLETDEIVEELRKGSIPKKLNTLTKTCRQRMTDPDTDHPSKPDDCTVIAFRRGETPEKIS